MGLESIFQSSTIIFLIAFLVSASAIYNAYMLRGGKLAQSQIFITLGMISFMLATVVSRFVQDMEIIKNISVSDAFSILGFVLLFVASVRLHASFK